MTNARFSPLAPELLHAWAIYLQASEEARRRGDRRTGTAREDRFRMTPAPKKVLEEAYKPKGHRRFQNTGPEVLVQILALQPPVPAALLLGALGVNTSEVRRRLDAW